MLIYLPIKIKSKANNANDIATGIIQVNKFFAHWIKEVDIKKYGYDIPLPLKTVEVYRYSDDMLKHMPEKTLETFEEKLLYCKKRFL